MNLITVILRIHEHFKAVIYNAGRFPLQFYVGIHIKDKGLFLKELRE